MILKPFNCNIVEMNNRLMYKQNIEKVSMKATPIYNPNLEILPNLCKAAEFYSTQNINGSNKSSQNSTDDNESTFIRSNRVLKQTKSKSVSSLFSASDDCRNFTLQLESVKKSLKFSIESMVYGQKLQMNAELLLLSSSNDLWPLSLYHLNKVHRNFNVFSDCYDELLSSLNQFGDVLDQFERAAIGCDNARVSIENKIMCCTELLNSVITIMELTYQTVYNIAASQPSWRRSPSGTLDRKTIISAIDEVELCCFRLREVLLRSSSNDDNREKDLELQGVMLFACSEFSLSLTYLAMCCRTASASIDVSIKSVSDKANHQSNNKRPEANLFQLAIKSVSKSSQCMLASVKNYVHDPNPENKFITESFTNSVSSAVKSLAAMATSPKFTGYPSALPLNIKMTRNTICGSCVSLVSPTTQLLQTIAAIYSPNNSAIRSISTVNCEQLNQRAITCTAAIRDALLHFQHTLRLYQNY